MKLLVLYTRLSGYSVSCLRAFRNITDAEILIYAWPNRENAPFDMTIFSDVSKIL